MLLVAHLIRRKQYLVKDFGRNFVAFAVKLRSAAKTQDDKSSVNTEDSVTACALLLSTYSCCQMFYPPLPPKLRNQLTFTEMNTHLSCLQNLFKNKLLVLAFVLMSGNYAPQNNVLSNWLMKNYKWLHVIS